MNARRKLPVGLKAVLAALALTFCLSSAHSQDGGPIKIGILHSQSGTMAISESVLADTVSMLIKQQNEKGGLLGRRLEAVSTDPASEPDVFAATAEKMLRDDRVAVVFGGWTSASRRAMVPVFEKHNGLLFYPVQFEGQENSRNVFYTGAVPNQQMLPALRYLMSKQGGSIRRWFLLGTDYVFPRTANEIVEAYLRNAGVVGEDIVIRYVPFTVNSWKEIVREIKAFGAAGKRTAVISTVSGDSNLGLYRELGAQELTAADIPVMAFSIGERELHQMEPKLLEGHMAARAYFSSITTPANEAFARSWRAYTGKSDELTNDQMEATMIGFRMWTQAVTQAGTVDVDAVRQAMYGQRFASPSGFEAVMNSNHMISKPAMIAKVDSRGVFEVIWRSQIAISADTWSKYLPDTAGLTADWAYPWICGGCAEPTIKD